MVASYPLSNVVIVSDYAYVNGGASRVAISTANALASTGLNIHYFAAVGPISPDLQVETTCLGTTPYNESGFRRSALSGLWDRRSEEAFSAVLAKIGQKGTVVHFHSNRDALSSSAFSPVFRNNFAGVYTCHEYGLACPYSSFFDHNADAICHRRGLSTSCLVAHCNRKGYDRKVWTIAKQLVQNRLLHVPDRLREILFVSEFSRRIIEPYIGAGPKKHVLRNPSSFNRQPVRKLAQHAPFLFAGLLTPGKGPAIAATAAKHAGVPIVFVGDGEERDAVLAANPDAVITGWLSPDRVREEMCAARALVLPAVWYETQGLVVQEAASLGVPAIVSETCAASEEIDSGCNGLLVPTNDPIALGEAMKKLMDDAVAQKLGVAAYEKFWEDPPTMERHLKQLLPIYEEALAGG